MSAEPRRFRQWVLEDWTILVGRLTYKPGATLEVRAVYDGIAATVFRISQSVPDATGRESENIQVMVQEDLPPVCCQREAMEFIRCVIEKVERHETDEWFRLDGKHVTEPHPEILYRKGAKLKRAAACRLITMREDLGGEYGLAA